MTQDELHADWELARESWRKHYPIEARSEEFIPHMIEHDLAGDCDRAAEWIGTFRGLMVDKYGTSDDTEHRVMYILEDIGEAYLDRIWEVLGIGAHLELPE